MVNVGDMLNGYTHGIVSASLGGPHMVVRPMARSGGQLVIDQGGSPAWTTQGGILTALGKAEYLEYKTRCYAVLV